MRIEQIAKERNLLCATCLSFDNCKILKRLKEMKASLKQGVQAKLGDTSSTLKESFQVELSLLEEERKKCLKKRIFVHVFKPQYICFRDWKYEHGDNVWDRYCYCNKWKEYLLVFGDRDPSIEELGWD